MEGIWRYFGGRWVQMDGLWRNLGRRETTFCFYCNPLTGTGGNMEGFSVQWL